MKKSYSFLLVLFLCSAIFAEMARIKYFCLPKTKLRNALSKNKFMGVDLTGIDFQ